MHLSFRHLGVAVGTLALSSLVPVTAAPVLADAPSITVALDGSGVSLRPAFDPAISRYAVATDASTDGTVGVAIADSDPGASVRVDGSPASGLRTLHGLTSGQEVSVIVDDSGGHHVYTLVYLPPDFPAITKTVDTGAEEPGQVLLTLGSYAVAVDVNGVPTVLRDFGSPVADLKPAPHGRYTVMVRRPTTNDWDLYELDNTFATVAPSPYRTVGLANTDSHDSILEPDGTRYFVAYEPDAVTGLTDPVIQQVGPDGQAVYTWDGGDHLDPATETTTDTGSGPASDWAHINAIQVLPDGDVLASFRHLSAVMRIAWSDHDGFQRGDVEWRFGGRLSDFAFPDDPYGGPCAQHAARILADGHLLVWDNGSGALGANPSYCVDPADRSGPTVERTFTRVTEYSLDTGTMTAHLVSSWSYPGRFAYFAGSAFRLDGGDTLLDWAAYTGALVSEADASGAIVWELSAPTTWSYRAQKSEVPDTTAPAVAVTLPGAGRYDVGDRITPSVTCTDAGGSSLQSCTWSASTLATGSAGTRTFSVTAVDGAGNTTVVRRSYSVGSAQPGIAVRTDLGWRSTRVLHLRHRGVERSALIRLTNRSAVARSLALVVGRRPPTGYRMHVRRDGHDITRSVLAGTWHSPLLTTGRTVTVRVVVQRGARMVPDWSRVRLLGAVTAASGVRSAVTLVLRSR